ncbi:D-2-hydroxyacid dehydrogenase [Dactylosporangium sp. NPDC051541]|uniref:D-2-hydroxyacid dehydrogenase n=1 Tax=Dactylosporangium sp. NPDC051541 TaxID=3363977 RepID=UPI0037958103
MTGLPVVVRGLGLDDAERQELRDAAGPGLDLRFPADGADVDFTDVVAAVGRVGDAELAAAPALRWIHLWTAGADHAFTPGLLARPEITLSASAGNGAVGLAEHAILLLLLLDRGGWHWARAQREHRWDPATHGELAGRTIGLVGFGNAGRHLAGIARGMGMRVLATRRTAGDDPAVDAMYPPDRLTRMLPECDAVVVTAPLTPQTRGLLGEAEFRAMKPTAYYVNVSRGEVADADALDRALDEGWIAGAGLDAHHVEPLPPGSPLWDRPNVLVTPHNGSTSRQSRRRSFDTVAANLRRFAAGAPLASVVDRTAGY